MRKSTLFTLLSLSLLPTLSVSALTLKFQTNDNKDNILKVINESVPDRDVTVDFSGCKNADDECVSAALEKFNKSLTALLCQGCTNIKFHFTKESTELGVTYGPLYTFPNSVTKVDLSETALDWEGFVNLIAITKKVDSLDLSSCDFSGVLPEEDELSEELVESTSLRVNSSVNNPFEPTEVKKLHLNDIKFCESGIESLLGYCSGLTELEVKGVDLDASGFDAISALKGLKSINLEGSSGLTHETLSSITGLALHKLFIADTGLSLDQMGSTTFPYVSTLSIQIGQPGWFTGQTVGESLNKAFPSLTQLNVESNDKEGITDKDLKSFNKLKMLISLDLTNCTEITARGVITFLEDRKADKACQELTSLILSNQSGLGHTTIMEIVKQAPKLQTFTVNRNLVRRITGESLKCERPNLKLILKAIETENTNQNHYEGCIK